MVLVSGALIVSLIGAAVLVSWAAAREHVTPVTPVSTSGGAGRALIVYHPGLSEFPDRVLAAFAQGLGGAGWRVDRTTASEKAPAELAGYDLLVLGSPVYANAAATPLTAYLERLGDLGGKPVALVFTAAGDADPALLATVAQVGQQHGRVVGRFGYTTQRPNGAATAASSNTAVAVAMAREAGEGLRLAAP